MEQKEIKEKLKSILHKHWCKSTAAKDDYYENALNAMEEAYSLNRSVPTAIDIKELKDLFSSVHQLIAGWNATEAQWSEWDKEVYDKLMDFWKRLELLDSTIKLKSVTTTSSTVTKLPTEEDIKRWFQLLVGVSKEAMYEDMNKTFPSTVKQTEWISVESQVELQDFREIENQYFDEDGTAYKNSLSTNIAEKMKNLINTLENEILSIGRHTK